MSGVSTREARYKVAVRLRRQGLTGRVIAERMGVSPSYVADILSDPDRSKTLARRERYRGVCEVCGNPTDPSGGYALQRTRCITHNGGGEWSRATAGTRGFTRDVLVLIGDGLDRYSDLRDGLGITSSYASVMLNRLVGVGYVERVSRGRYRLTALGVEKTAASA